MLLFLFAFQRAPHDPLQLYKFFGHSPALKNFFIRLFLILAKQRCLSKGLLKTNSFILFDD
ncbi:hypothetical protein EBX31_07370 [bacterium]|nr:hypothetical protein [bacterium]